MNIPDVRFDDIMKPFVDKVIVFGTVCIMATPTLSTLFADSASAVASVNYPLPAVGLSNLGNTCYMNAILQSLSSLDTFVEHVDEKIKSYNDCCDSSYPHLDKEDKIDKNFIAGQLSRILGKLRKHDMHTTISAYKLADYIEEELHPKFIIRRQQDAHEFLDLLIDLFQDEVTLIPKPSGTNSGNVEPKTFFGTNSMFQTASLSSSVCMLAEDPSSADDALAAVAAVGSGISDPKDLALTPLHGLVASTLRCTKCGWSKPSSDTQSICLSLSLTTSNSHGLGLNRGDGSKFHLGFTLTGYLAEYLREELVDDVFCEGCQQCERNTKKDNDDDDVAWRKDMRELNHSDEYYQHCKRERDAWRENQEGLRGGDVSSGEENTTPPSIAASTYKEQHWKRLSIKRAPVILCIHLKRRSFDQRGEIKLEDHVQFDERLVLPGHEEKEYILMSVVVHKGTFAGGHYLMYRRNKWEEKKKKKKKKKKKTTVEESEGEEQQEEKKRGKEKGEEKGEEKEVVVEEEEKLDDQEEKQAEEADEVEEVGVKKGPDWSYISDDYCAGVTWEEVADCQAYMLFYERSVPQDKSSSNNKEKQLDQDLLEPG